MASSLKTGSGSVASRLLADKVTSATRELASASGIRAAMNGHTPTTNFSLESFQGGMAVNASIESTVKRAINGSFGDGYWDSLTDCQRDSAIIVARACASQESMMAYCRNYDSIGGVEKGTFGTPVAMGNAAPFEYTNVANKREWSTEVFDDRNLSSFAAVSIMHSVMAARQSPAAESLFPGYALPADGTGFTVEVDRPLVFDRIKHTTNGDTADFNKQRKLLLNALMDPTILASRGNEIIPYFVDGNATNNSHFGTATAPRFVSANGESFKTNYLRPGAPTVTSLLGISMHPGIASLGQNDQSDTLDHRVNLRTILLEVTTLDPANPAATVSSILKFRVDMLGFSAFNPAFEGQQRRMVLSFDTQDLPVDQNTLDIAGLPATALAFLGTNPAYANYRLNLAISIGGEVNLENSGIKVHTADGAIDTVQVMSGVGADRQFVPVSNVTELASIRAQFTSIKFVGYDVEAYRTNINRRDQGKLTTNERLKDSHILPYSPTFTAQVPVIDGIHNTVDISIPAQCLMFRNTNNAYSQLFTFEAALAQACDAYVKAVPSPAIRAIGRYILRRPWYELAKLDLAVDVNSLRSHERLQDIQAAITNKLRTMLTRAFYATNFQAAMSSVGLAMGAKPKVKIICNPILGNYLMTTGDNRTLGEGWTYTLETDQDERLFDIDANGKRTYRMYMVFSIDGIDGPHPLNFGNFVYLPDLMTNLPITRDQATTREMSYQSRTLHVNHCPILMRLDIENLETAVSERLAVPITPA
jgi:hypothetical protein